MKYSSSMYEYFARSSIVDEYGYSCDGSPMATGVFTGPVTVGVATDAASNQLAAIATATARRHAKRIRDCGESWVRTMRGPPDVALDLRCLPEIPRARAITDADYMCSDGT